MAHRGRVSRRGFLKTGALVAGVVPTVGAQVLGPGGSGKAEPARHPVLDSVDVLIVGGGPAGIGAAIGAARTGANTLLVENHAFFGGVGAWMLGMEINQMRPGGKPRSVVHELVIQKLQALGDEAVVIGTVYGHELWCNVEYLKVAIIDALDAAGARYLVHVRAVDALVERNRVAGVVVGTKRGLMAIRAKVVVDCTGDCDVAAFAGAETMIEAKSLMPATLGLSLGNVDASRLTANDISAAIRRGRSRHPLIPSGFLEIRPVARSTSTWFINHSGTADMGRVDVTDPVERTRAECQGRRQGLQIAKALREADDPSLRQIEWVAGSPQLAVRESRRIKGLYVISEQDTRTGQKFDDAIAWRAGWMDPGGEIGGAGGEMKTYHVPYRALVPEKVDGLLVAGRCISTSHVAAAAAKSMGNCVATGHAAGLAAAAAASRRIEPRAVSVPELQAKLRADGVSLEI